MKFILCSFVVALSQMTFAQSGSVRMYEATCATATKNINDGLTLVSAELIRELTFEGLVKKCKARSGTHLFKSVSVARDNARIGKSPGLEIVAAERATVMNSVRFLDEGDTLVKPDGSL